MRKIFVTGIGTDAGKTLVSAIVAQALEADYWKPVQAGNLERPDSVVIQELLSSPESVIHPETYSLREALSPHAAASRESIKIEAKRLSLPPTKNEVIVIEGAGGLMVPLSANFLVVDLIQQLEAEVILVSRNYLGSINHTLLSLELIAKRELPMLGLIFNGPYTPSTENFISSYAKVPIIGRIEKETYIDQLTVERYAGLFRRALKLPIEKKLEQSAL